MPYRLTREMLNRLDMNHLEEWVLANGIGGFSAGSVLNASFRKQHGYLIISKKPPIRRFLVLARTEEKILFGEETVSLACQKTASRFLRGDRFLESFTLDEAVTYRYAVKGIILEKTIAPLYGKNAVGIHYVIQTGSQAAKLAVTPLFNHRPHSDIANGETLKFAEKQRSLEWDLVPEADPSTTIRFLASAGAFVPETDKITEPFVYDFEVETGDPRMDVHYRPFSLQLDLPAQAETRLSVVVTTEPGKHPTAEQIVRTYRTRAKNLVKDAGFSDDFTQRLVLAADQFVCRRESTGKATVLAGLPWFTDWGRDTMIAFEGLLLVTKRFGEAKEILESFAKYEKDGLIPNMFPDGGEEPIYNTVDASLWFIHAASRYLEYTGDDAFVKGTLMPVLVSIVDHYKKGTRFSIGMDKDGLLRAGSGLDQVTWMDVRINGEVITPRHGKPVEINALWHNALRILAKLSKRYGKEFLSYRLLAEKVRAHFNRRFWNPEKNCLYDVVDPQDPSVRPNQLYALSLPYPLLSRAKARRVMETVRAELFDVGGIRTLSVADPRFKPVYTGPLEARDRAYHMGTAWPFLAGAYVDAFLNVSADPGACREAAAILLSYKGHLNRGCLNGIPEIVDGFHGTISRGCYTQAWSVGEILRAYAVHHLADARGEEK